MLKTRYRVRAYGATDCGRRPTNEDAHLICLQEGLFLVADGMGGRLAGEVAAKKALELLAQNKERLREDPSLLKESIVRAGETIYRLSKEEPACCGMGTTLCALLLHGEEVLYGHVGDSRIYLLRQKSLLRLTEDHSLVSDLISLGILVKEEESDFPYKNVLTKALGTQPYVEPTLSNLPLQAGDLFLLASDGLTASVDDASIGALLRQPLSLQEIASQLISIAKERGGTDNITVLLVSIS